MKFFQYILVASLICIFFLQSGCNKKNKWKAVPLTIKKQESIYYSEIVSGDLDSTAKAELEAVKNNTIEKMDNDPKEIKKNSAKNKKGNSIWMGIPIYIIGL